MFKYILYDVAKLIRYGPQSAIFGLIVLIVWCVFTTKKKKPFSEGKAGAAFLLGAYIVMVLELAIIDRVPNAHTGYIELSLLHSTRWANMRAMTIENVLMFIPYGFLCPVLWDLFKKWYITIPIGVCLSILIEATQFVTGRGYCQLEDLVMNSVGTIVGYLFFRMLYTIRVRKEI